MEEIIICVDENDNEVGHMKKLMPILKEYFIGHYQYLFLMRKMNYFCRKDIVENIIHLVFGQILVVHTLIKMKVQTLLLKDVCKRKWDFLVI